MFAKAHRRGPKVNSGINVTPMVDVMQVLLIIFMVITPMLTPGKQVEMAKTSNPREMPDVNKDDALIVVVLHDGTIFLGAEMINDGALAQRIKDQLSTRNDKTIYLRADARVHYRTVMSVVDDIRAGGADQLGLLTEQTQRRSSAGAPQI